MRNILLAFMTTISLAACGIPNTDFPDDVTKLELTAVDRCVSLISQQLPSSYSPQSAKLTRLLSDSHVEIDEGKEQGGHCFMDSSGFPKTARVQQKDDWKRWELSRGWYGAY